MMHGNRPVSVPPGFRFHPTDEELLYYYLKKKVSYQPIDLDVIVEVDLNTLEPWDLKEKCRIGSGLQNEWYFFSHKDKKYPTSSRTNRATIAGFWKATGRDKTIDLGNGKRIGMRKTLVFYTGRAPHGNKTHWIMHEYRLNDNDTQLQEEDGWVVCRLFIKKNPGRGIQVEVQQKEDNDNYTPHSTYTSTTTSYTQQSLMIPSNYSYPLDNTMQLPQLSSHTDSVAPMDNLLMRLGPSVPQMLAGGGGRVSVNGGGEWEVLAGFHSLAG